MSVGHIRMEGDVRLTLCISFDQFISSMFSHEGGAEAVVFDLRAAEGIDSTTLGLMAKIAIGAKNKGLPSPVIVTDNNSIIRLLESMGFEEIFEVSKSLAIPQASEEQSLGAEVSDESNVQQTVLEAHKILMDLNQPNKARFHELVETLQNKF